MDHLIHSNVMGKFGFILYSTLKGFMERNNKTQTDRQFIDLGQFLPSEVEGDSFCVARVVDFNMNLVVILILSDQCSL